MWVPTLPKVISEIDGLMSRFSVINDRVSDHESQHALANRAGLYKPAPQLYAMRQLHDELSATLVDAKSGILNGAVDFRVIAKQLPSLKRATKHFENVLNETDQGVAAAKAAFQARYGK